MSPSEDAAFEAIDMAKLMKLAGSSASGMPASSNSASSLARGLVSLHGGWLGNGCGLKRRRHGALVGLGLALTLEASAGAVSGIFS